MTIDASTPIAPAEGTALLPLRAFGETNTLTLPRMRRRDGRSDMAARVVEAAIADAVSSVRVAIVAADADPLTLTF